MKPMVTNEMVVAVVASLENFQHRFLLAMHSTDSRKGGNHKSRPPMLEQSTSSIDIEGLRVSGYVAAWGSMRLTCTTRVVVVLIYI
jgi:hypothetical protein